MGKVDIKVERPFATIKPYKRMCYYNALRLAQANPEMPWFVVHGLVTPTIGECAGRQMGHAWNEIDRNGERCVYDPSIDLWTSAADYYERLSAVAIATYTLDEVQTLVDASGGLVGPWDERLTAAHHHKPQKKTRPRRASTGTPTGQPP